MTATEFRAALEALGMTERLFAAELGRSRVTVSRWARGHTRVPRYAEVVVRALRDFAEIQDRLGRLVRRLGE